MNHLEVLSRTLATVDAAQLSGLKTFVSETPGTLWLCGNGGSFANAMHWGCDLGKTARRRVGVLGVNQSQLTAWSNDVSYEGALAQELAHCSRAGDRLLCLSCSGTSQNIVTVLRQAYILRMPCGILTGLGHPWPTPVSVIVNVPHADYGVIEDVHMAIGHWLTNELRDL